MADQKKSPIVRSWKTTIYYIIGAVLGLALSVWMFKNFAEGPISIGFSLIPGILGLIFIFMSISGSAVAPCPGCGEMLGGLSTKSNDGVACLQCRHYFEGKDGLLWATDESRIADSPIFTTDIPERFNFPDACCVCGNPTSHRQKIELTTTNASTAITAPTIGMSTTTRTSVEVPHCAEHKDGASLSGTAQHTRIRFRSYPYLRAFCEMNQTKPG